MITRPETVELAKYMLLFTTKFSGSTAQVLEFYRIRWQIELVFKRLKTLVQWDRYPGTTTAVPVLGYMGNCLLRYSHRN